MALKVHITCVFCGQGVPITYEGLFFHVDPHSGPNKKPCNPIFNKPSATGLRGGVFLKLVEEGREG